MPTLVLTPRFTEDSQSLWRTAGRLGWDVHRLTSWRIPDTLRNVHEPVLFLEALFGPTLAEHFGLRLLEPPIDWLPRLPEEHRKRWVTLSTLGLARRRTERAFVKPPNDKSFPAGAYVGSDLPSGFDDSMPVLVSELVRWEVEFRCFVLDRVLRACSVYLRSGVLQRDRDYAATEAELADAAEFLGRVLADPRVDLPRATVVDVGTIAERGWAVVEQNAAWGSGLYGCDPAEVLEVLRHAAVPIDDRAAP